MEQYPRVSIGLAVYNGERYLAETIDSILAQTFHDFELIISDNASTDHTQEIARAYAAKDERIRYYRNAKNLGIAPNYNRVIGLARGEYFKLADYDDLLAPTFLECCIAILDSMSSVVVCYARARLIDENGFDLGPCDPKPDTGSPQPHERFRKLILEPHLAIQSMGLMRRDAIMQTRLYGSYPSSDEVFLAELSLWGQYYEIQDRLISIRIHAKQTTKGTYTLQRDRVLLFDTSLTDKISLPKWWYLSGCLRAIANAPLLPAERFACYITMLKWLSIPAHIRALVKDFLLAAYKLIKRCSQINFVVNTLYQTIYTKSGRDHN
jgi:glycosyltransferase involved in cell wall biosynthesis